MSTTPTRTRNPAFKATIADQLLQGYGITELAEQYGYSYEGMRRLARSEEVAELMKDRQAKVADAGGQAMFTFLLNARVLSEMHLRTALDGMHPDSYRARSWILDRIIPKRDAPSSGDLAVQVNINSEVINGLTTALRVVGTAMGTSTGTPVMVEGKNALPSIDVKMVPEED